MERQVKYIRRSRNLNNNGSYDDPGRIIIPGDHALFENISIVMRGVLDIEEARKDPMYGVMDESARKMISGFDLKDLKHESRRRFIRDSGLKEKEEEEQIDEISDIREDIRKNNVDKITAGWVDGFHDRTDGNDKAGEERRARRRFISDALANAEKRPQSGRVNYESKPGRKLIRAWYSLPAAAAILGGFLLFKALVPSGDPDSIFADYYEPMSAVSRVTRSSPDQQNESFRLAAENYNKGNYEAAAAGFIEAGGRDPLNTASLFYLGLSHLALGNYSRSAGILEEAVSTRNEYSKDATWYLGLSYLKTGDTEKALKCFEVLAGSPGFYSARAGRILRRLR